MRSKVILLILIASVSLLLIYLQWRIQRFAHQHTRLTSPQPIQLPYKWVGNISPLKKVEPSGITYHPQRRTVFVVGDEGHLYEMRTDGEAVRTEYLKQADLEGITVNPVTGFLYAVVEGEEMVFEIDPQTFRVTRKFTVNRNFAGRELLKKGGMGLEAIVFIPDASHPEGGTFWVGNQSFSLKPGKEPSIICEVVLPLISSKTGEGRGQIIRFFPLSIIDISGLAYDPQRQCLLVMSDTTNLLLEVTLDGNVRRQYLIPGADQEGVVLDKMGFIYIAQENGEVIKIEDRRD
jgi:uncharacterized protein YjiK